MLLGLSPGPAMFPTLVWTQDVGAAHRFQSVPSGPGLGALSPYPGGHGALQRRGAATGTGESWTGGYQTMVKWEFTFSWNSFYKGSKYFSMKYQVKCIWSSSASEEKRDKQVSTVFLVTVLFSRDRSDERVSHRLNSEVEQTRLSQGSAGLPPSRARRDIFSDRERKVFLIVRRVGTS